MVRLLSDGAKPEISTSELSAPFGTVSVCGPTVSVPPFLPMTCAFAYSGSFLHLRSEPTRLVVVESVVLSRSFDCPGAVGDSRPQLTATSAAQNTPARYRRAIFMFLLPPLG